MPKFAGWYKSIEAYYAKCFIMQNQRIYQSKGRAIKIYKIPANGNFWLDFQLLVTSRMVVNAQLSSPKPTKTFGTILCRFVLVRNPCEKEASQQLNCLLKQTN